MKQPERPALPRDSKVVPFQAQRHLLAELAAQGLLYQEIRARCEAFDPPFSPTRKIVDRYRQAAGVQLAALIAAGERTALNTGLALREVRVAKLRRLARKMEKDLLRDGKLWTDDAKTVAKDPYHYKLFNRAEVEAYRGVLDDIAREVGGRVSKLEIEAKSYVVKPAPEAPRDVTPDLTAEVKEA